MVKKKANPVKEPKKAGEAWVAEDVKVYTGLPPKVDGQLRCFCKVSVNQVLWSKASPPTTLVRLKWWGEDGEGAEFRPLDIKKGNKSAARTTARYPVRSGPRQFASYLNDMGTLTLEVFTSGTTSAPAGQTQIPQIGLLSNNRPINGFFPILSPKEEKIGELQVSVVLEPLMASYDKQGTIPTTDINMDPHHSQDSLLPKTTPQPHAQRPVKPLEDPFISPASHMTEDSRQRNAPRQQNAADVRQTLQYGPSEAGHKHKYPVAVTASGEVVGMSDLHGNGVPVASRRGAASSQPQAGSSDDLLSVLLSRGNNLRQRMVISSLTRSDEEEQEQNNNSMPQPTPPPVSKTSPVKASFTLGPGVTLDNLLGDGGPSPLDMLIGSPVGKHEWQMLRLMNGASPGPSQCSDAVDVMDLFSEQGDPLHDRTLLQELFYKHSASEMSELSGLSGDEDGVHMHNQKEQSSGSLQDPGNARPPSRASSLSSVATALPASDDPQVKKRKRKLKPKNTSSGSPSNVRQSRSKEKVPRTTQKVKTKKSKSRSRSRSGSRSRSKSRSLSRKRKGSVGGMSDSDVPSTPRSETSRVSFDPVPSDAEEQDLDDRDRKADGLSVERLTLLGRVHVARVNILNLQLSGCDLDTSSSSKASGRSARRGGKPPRPVKNRKPCTYLIEYQFPVVATSRDKYSPNAMATEVMRVASKSINSGVVSFGHRSVFPLMFDGAALEKWWKSALIFRVFAREAGQQGPVLLGSCGVPLKSILKSDDLHLTRELEIREVGRNSSLNNSARNASLNGSVRSSTNAPLLGTLKVTVELASDHKDFHTALARTRVAEMNSNGHCIVPVVPPPAPAPTLPPPNPLSPGKKSARSHQSANQVPPLRLHQQPGRGAPLSQPVLPSSVPPSVAHDVPQPQKPIFSTSVAQTAADSMMSSNQEVLALHTLLVIPEGCNISLRGVPPLHMASRYPALLQQQPALQASSGSVSRDHMTRNTYLLCRMFWSNDSVHSDVCWGTLNPQYNFSQVAPVLVTPSLLERMRNNYMVIEVWDKKTTAESDKLIGIVKLSLHQFFMSFRDQKISSALLRSEYPVVAIDNYMPIVDPFSGLHYGQISVLLAMGSSDQVACLQRLKAGGHRADGGPPRPQHFLERQDVYSKDQTRVQLDSSGSSVEHVFEMVVQGVRGLKLLETMIWGEADCFVQYYFPAQSVPQRQGPTVVIGLPSMRSYRTATTLCVPDPTFHDVTRHKITLPVGTPVQRELLTACANSAGGGGGIPFEVWCRFYHPNVRDQVIARGTLPLAKLCAMVTMQKRGEPSVQSFALPLAPVLSSSHDAEGQAKMQDSGLIDVTVHYKTQVVEVSAEASVIQPSSGSQVCLSLGIIRASGLRTAAELIARLDSGMQYPAEVGVNAYVRVRLSFMGEQDERRTKTVARTFSPEFSHHLEFPLQLLWSGNHDDPGCLAQLLETGQAELEVWHQVPGLFPGGEMECDDITGGKQPIQRTGDVLLGTSVIPLAALLRRQSGICGWFSIHRPRRSWAEDEGSETPDAAPSRLVGGLELNLCFAHTSDRQRVVETGRSVGWSPVDPLMEERDWQQEAEEGQQEHHQLVVSVEQVSLPLARVLLPGQTSLDPSARCYVRYKFYDRAAVVSRTARLQGEGERLQAVVQHRHTLVLPRTAPFQWYLREEHLEVQVWVTFGSKDKGQRPLQRDKLIGTAFVDLHPLVDVRRRQHRISGLLPLFKPGVASLAGAFVQLHLTSNLCKRNQLLDDEDDVVENGEVSDVDYDSNDSFHQLAGGARSPSKSRSTGTKAAEDSSAGPVFTVHLSVERALHLPSVRPSGSSEEVAPTTYISYQTAGRTAQTYSDIVASSANPVWDHATEVQLSRELLTRSDKHLVLKVWHKPADARKQPDKSSDRVLGFVSVDLCPLASGLRQICGWYNIVDFTGQSRGQIKVSITPVDLDVPSNSVHATQGPNISISSSRGGGSVCLPGNPVPGLSFLPLPLSALSHLLAGGGGGGGSADNAGLAAASLPAPTAAHWQPRFPAPAGAAGDTSKSVLFSSLRQQLRDLDSITNRLRLRLSCEDSDIDANQPASARSADILTGTQSGLSTIHTTSSLNATRDISDTSRQHNASMLGSREISSDTSQQQVTASEENTSNNGLDSGAFSGDNTGKSHEALDSQRSEKQVAFGAARGQGSSLLSGLPPSGAQLTEAAASLTEVHFLLGSVQAAPTTPRSPRDFSSNSQTSQGFQPTATVPSEGSTSGSSLAHRQQVPSLTNLTNEEGDDEGDENRHTHSSSGTGLPQPATDDQDYLLNHARNSDSDDNSQQDEMFGSYHHYRALLDEEEADAQQGEEEEDGDSNVQVVTPRRLNDVSGMLRQFTQQPGTLPPSFLQGVPASANSILLQTWPSLPQQGRGLEQGNQGDGESGEEEERDEEKGETTEVEMETLRLEMHEEEVVQGRKSFIDSWLEDSAEHKHDTVIQAGMEAASSGVHLYSQTLVQPFPLDDDAESDAEEHEADTPHENGLPEGESGQQEEHVTAPKMHLLSNVEFIDSLTSVKSSSLKKKQRQADVKNGVADSRRAKERSGPAACQDQAAFENGIHLQSWSGPHDRHLLSNVELHSTVSSYHPAARQPRHLLSNVELASTASGSSQHPDSASSRPSRQSSANSANRQRELQTCEEEEHIDDDEELGRQQPVSARSEEVSDFFAAEAGARQGRVVVNGGGYDSSDEEDFQYQYAAGARAAGSSSRVLTGKPRDMSHSLACTSDRTATEDSGLESGAKSSQDERDGLSLLDSTQCQLSLQGAAANVPQFFPPAHQLQASMRALQMTTGAATSQGQQNGQVSRSADKAQASSDLVQRLQSTKVAAKFNGAVSTKGRQLPTAEEAKRIAKIFSSKVP